MRTALPAALISLALLAAGCGGNDNTNKDTPRPAAGDDVFLDGGAAAPAEDPAVIVRNLLTALAEGNGNAACSILSEDVYLEEQAEAGAADCASTYAEPDPYIAYGLTNEKSLVSTPGYDPGASRVQWRHLDEDDDGVCDVLTVEPTGVGGALLVERIERADREDMFTPCEYGE